MIRSTLLSLIVMLPVIAQDPFQPMNTGGFMGTPTVKSARVDWVRLTNERFKMSGKSMRVAAEGPEGLTAVVLAPGIEKPRHAKPILLGKDEHALLFRSILAEGFNRIVVRNPDSGQEWATRLEWPKIPAAE